MSVLLPPTNKPPCNNCIKFGRCCVPGTTGAVCKPCKRAKAGCSLTGTYSFDLDYVTSTESPTILDKGNPAPSKSRPKRKVDPAPTPLPAPGKDRAGKGKVQDPPAVVPSSPRTRPGPLSANRPFVEINVPNVPTRKRTFGEAGHDEDDGDDDEYAFLAGRLNGLQSFIDVFETTFAALKKEVADINSYLGSKRRRLQ